MDILVAGKELPDLTAIAASMPGQLSVSRYSWEELRHMAGYGSLFLHHVRLEGRALVETAEKRLEGLLRTLAPYSRASRELECFSRVVDDVDQTLEGDHRPLLHPKRNLFRYRKGEARARLTRPSISPRE